MSKESKDFFWPSYVDLMTVLFIVMLVLFVLSYKMFHDKDKENRENIRKLQVELIEKKKIDEIKKALAKLDGDYFKYNERYKRHELLVDIIFDSGSPVIPKKNLEALKQAGEELSNVLGSLKDDNVKYLIVIDGRAARYAEGDARNISERDFAFDLSYKRALALVKYWRSSGINLPKDKIELVAAGSGFEGADRFGNQYDRRFVIQILPKVGTLNTNTIEALN